jgi:RNA polymerase sigma-70 factor (ECF subfamily)
MGRIGCDAGLFPPSGTTPAHARHSADERSARRHTEPEGRIIMEAGEKLEHFEEVLLPLMDDAYTLARYLTRDPHDAQDAVQEAYLRALRYFGSYRGGDARAWFLTIVRHCCYTLRRRRQLGPELGPQAAADAADAVEAPPAYAADARALERDDRAAVARALAGLAPEFREALVLRELQGLSYREIARVVGVPIGTVMSRLARARRRVQDMLGLTSREAS